MRFLSDEWLLAASHRVESMELIDSPDVVIEQRIVDGERDDLIYSVAISGGRAELTSGPARSPIVVITESWATAQAVYRGDRPALDAVLTGDIAVTGDVVSLSGVGTAFAAIGVALDELRPNTTF